LDVFTQNRGLCKKLLHRSLYDADEPPPGHKIFRLILCIILDTSIWRVIM